MPAAKAAGSMGVGAPPAPSLLPMDLPANTLPALSPPGTPRHHAAEATNVAGATWDPRVPPLQAFRGRFQSELEHKGPRVPRPPPRLETIFLAFGAQIV